MRSLRMSLSRREWPALVMAAALLFSACGSDKADEQVEDAPVGLAEIEYSNGGSAPIEFDIIRVDWADGAILESASFLDGVDLGVSGTSPAQGPIETVIPADSTDWLRLSFDGHEAPEGLTVTMVTSTGATLTHEYGS